MCRIRASNVLLTTWRPKACRHTSAVLCQQPHCSMKQQRKCISGWHCAPCHDACLNADYGIVVAYRAMHVSRIGLPWPLRTSGPTYKWFTGRLHGRATRACSRVKRTGAASTLGTAPGWRGNQDEESAVLPTALGTPKAQIWAATHGVEQRRSIEVLQQPHLSELIRLHCIARARRP